MLFWVIIGFAQCLSSPVSRQFGVHVIFQTDVSEDQHNWAMKLIRRSMYKASSMEEYILQQRDMAEQIDLLVKWQDYLVSRSIMILIATEKSSPVGFINDRLEDTFVIIFGTEQAYPKSSFCAGRKIKLEVEQTGLFVTDRQVKDQIYPTNLVDFMSICYDIDHETDSMLVACVNGDLVNGNCICFGRYGFTGSRCQFADLADLDCSPGYAMMSPHSEPVCHCPQPNGGRQYCGEAPCPGLCEYCSRRSSGDICGVVEIGLNLGLNNQEITMESPNFKIVEKTTTVSTPNTEETVTTANPTSATTTEEVPDVTSVTDCQNGMKVGSDCICDNGFTGQKCEIGPIHADCNWDNIQINISDSYQAKIADYYVPGGSFHLCQTRQSCQREHCFIKKSKTHGNTECGAKITRTKSTTTVENNVFWKIPGRNSFIPVGHYECIYENQININKPNAEITCCAQSSTHVVRQNSFNVKPQLWRKDENDAYEVVTDSTSWIVDEPVILRLVKSDYTNIEHYQHLGFESCLLVNHEDINQALIKLPIIDHGCPTTFARERLDLNVSINTNDDISLEFKAFNWKQGGQVYVFCEFSICENCEQECTDRHRREVVHLEAKMIGHGQVKQGPLNARSKKADVVSKEELEYYKLVNGIVSCIVGVLCALVLYKLIKKIVMFTTKE